MSVNISVYSETKTPLKKHKGKFRTVIEEFDLLQTPTNVSYKIINSPDQAGAYIDWVNETYDMDTSCDHIAEFRQWLKEHKDSKIVFDIS